jgi:hypothetical protein
MHPRSPTLIFHRILWRNARISMRHMRLGQTLPLALSHLRKILLRWLSSAPLYQKRLSAQSRLLISAHLQFKFYLWYLRSEHCRQQQRCIRWQFVQFRHMRRLLLRTAIKIWRIKTEGAHSEYQHFVLLWDKIIAGQLSLPSNLVPAVQKDQIMPKKML